MKWNIIWGICVLITDSRIEHLNILTIKTWDSQYLKFPTKKTSVSDSFTGEFYINQKRHKEGITLQLSLCYHHYLNTITLTTIPGKTLGEKKQQTCRPTFLINIDLNFWACIQRNWNYALKEMFLLSHWLQRYSQ